MSPSISGPDGAPDAGHALVVERHEGVMALHLNRTQRRNALDLGLMYALGDALTTAATDDDIRVVVIAARGDVFCAGVDLKAFAAAVDAQGEDNEMSLAARTGASAPRPGLGVLIREPHPKPVICAVQGPALGLGCEIALASDVVVASRSATFGLPEVRHGLAPSGGGAARLVKRFPTALALWMLLSGVPVDAVTATRHGLVTRLLEDDRPPLDIALEMAEVIASHPPAAVRATKALALRSIHLFDPEVQALGDELLDGLLARPDAAAVRTRSAHDPRPPDRSERGPGTLDKC